MASGQSIGDLFVKLGFDVDDSKLKSFDASIKETFSTIMRFAGVGAGVGGFVALAKNASDTALQIANLTTVYGTSAKAIQAWGAAVHESNPLKSYAEGIASFGNIAQYLSNAAFTPSGTVALNRLGVSFHSDDIQHPERIIAKLFESIPKLLKEHPENRALYSSLVGDVTGDPTNLRVFEKGKDFQDAAASRVSLYQKELDDTVKVAQDIAALQDEWDKFYKHAIGTLAGGFIELQKNIKEKGFIEGLGVSLDELGAANPYKLDSIGKALIQNPVMNAAVNSASRAIQDFGGARHESREFWEAKGLDAHHIAAWLAQEEAESGYGTNKNTNKGKYKGAFQWSPERRQQILEGTGIDVANASHWQQLQAADWEYRKMGLEDKFKQTKGSRDATKFLSDKFEVHEKISNRGDEYAYRQNLAEKQLPDLQVNVTQHIHSNADAGEVARIANDRISRLVLGTYLEQTGVHQ